MIYLGIDPSFSGTGVTILDPDSKTIKFLAVKPPGTNDNYRMMLNRSAYVAVNVIRHLPLDREIRVVLEEPLLTSQRASTLGLLSASVVWSLAYLDSVKEMYSINPNYIRNLNRKIAKREGLSNKQTNKYVAGKVLDYFIERKGYSIEIYNDKTNKDGSMRKRNLTHDEADSLLLLIALLQDQGFLEPLDMRFLSAINRKFFMDSGIARFK